MSNALNKIAPNSPSRQSPSEIETSIASASVAVSNCADES
jgi:small subunit ribosomal protein S7e